MRTIGLLGGMSWESTAVYYRRLNERVRDRLGGLHSAEIVLRSVDFDRIVRLQGAGDWAGAGRELAAAAQALERAGADCLVICTNTMHVVADTVQGAVRMPLIHIVDETARVLAAAGHRRPLLLATRYTMEQSFYLDRMAGRHGLACTVPGEADRTLVHDVIFQELCRGWVIPTSRRDFLSVIERGRAAGADSVILGCTEIGMLLDGIDTGLPTYDSTFIHADAAADFAMDLALAA